MDRTTQVRQVYEHMNARDFDADLGLYTEDMTFHAPGLGQDVQGRAAAIEVVRTFAEGADVRYEVEDVVEHGPFVVAFVRSNGDIDGARRTWDLCQVLRYEGDAVAEVWALRGGAPQAVG